MNTMLGHTTAHINKIIIHCAATPNGKAFNITNIDQWPNIPQRIKKQLSTELAFYFNPSQPHSQHTTNPVQYFPSSIANLRQREW